MNNSSESNRSQGVVVNGETCKTKSGAILRASGPIFIIKECARTIPHQFSGSTRGVISSFSASSGCRMRRYLRECLLDYQFMVTLTYPFCYPTNGKAAKEHLRKFLQELKRACYRQTDTEAGHHSSFWFLEFQSRGAPHFHIFTTWAPDKSWVSRRWYEIVNSDDIRHLHAGTRTEKILSGRAGTISYASKYAAKMEQKSVPAGFENIGRFWGIHGRRSVMAAATFVSRADKENLGVKSHISYMYQFINRMIFEGRMEIVHRSHGTLVINMLDEYTKRQMRMIISKMSALTMRWTDMFDDAEIEYGETLQCRLFA